MPENLREDQQVAPDIRPADMLTLLDALLAFGPIKSSKRLQALLRYLVTEEIAGRGERVNTYAVAFDVYGRDTDFDPRIDSIVRVEMYRLRQSLEAWRDNPDNPAEFALVLEPRKYRPSVIARQHEIETPAAAPPWHKRRVWVIVAGLILLGSIAASTMPLYLSAMAGRCGSQRPKAFLPSSIEGSIDTDTSKLLINRLERFMNYYTLVNAVKRSDNNCDGAPRFKISIRADQDNTDRTQKLLHVDATDLQSGKSIWTETYPLRPSISDQESNMLMAKIAFALSYDRGAIPTAASRATWKDQKSQNEYKCILSVSQLYTAMSESERWLAARKCLIDIFRTSTQADISGYLGSVELEPRFEPRLRALQTHDYYDEAIARGQQLDPRNADVLIAELRHSRTAPTINPVEINSVMRTLEENYPFHPEAAYQLAYTQSTLLAQYDLARENVKISQYIAPGEFDPNLAYMCILLKDGRIDDIKPHISALSMDYYVLSRLLVLNYADHANDDTLRQSTIRGIQGSLCSTRQCLEKELTGGAFHPDIYRPLMAAVDRHFPAAAPTARAIPSARP
ncbi:MAG: hypothetical protein JSR96_08670 [Proteobacteria bacterium]|nr:hypothetical protein [Pseudomonadota bacterium]